MAKVPNMPDCQKSTVINRITYDICYRVLNICDGLFNLKGCRENYKFTHHGLDNVGIARVTFTTDQEYKFIPMS